MDMQCFCHTIKLICYEFNISIKDLGSLIMIFVFMATAMKIAVLLGCDAMQFCRYTPDFRANLLPPSSGFSDISSVLKMDAAGFSKNSAYLSKRP